VAVRRFGLSLGLLALPVVGLVGTSRLPSDIAQSGRPMAGGTPSPGEQALAVGHVQTMPPVPADLALGRFTLLPGESAPIDKTGPTIALAYIESGALTVRFDGPLAVMRAILATPQAMEMPATEQLPANTTGTLDAGD
jgi:hypothetical protein